MIINSCYRNCNILSSYNSTNQFISDWIVASAIIFSDTLDIDVVDFGILTELPNYYVNAQIAVQNFLQKTISLGLSSNLPDQLPSIRHTAAATNCSASGRFCTCSPGSHAAPQQNVRADVVASIAIVEGRLIESGHNIP